MSEIEEQISLWPFHFKPLEDELLSIWLIRLAHAHGYKVEQLCTMLLGRGRRLWNSDVDKFQPPLLREALKRVTGITDAQLDAASLHSFEGYISDYFNAQGGSCWIVPLHIYHRTRKSPGLSYCPACLASDSVPYFRRAWRLSFATVCPHHGVELLDACPECSAPLAPHRVDIGPNGFIPGPDRIVYCPACGHDLRKAALSTAQPLLMDWTSRLLAASRDGYIGWGSREGVHSVLFFSGLRMLVTAIRKRVVHAEGSGSRTRNFDFLTVAPRRETMIHVAAAIAQGPEGLQAYARAHGINISDVLHSRESTPFWLTEALMPIMRVQHPKRSKEEVTEIARVAHNLTGAPLSQTQICLKFGLNVNDERADALRHFVSDDAYELLMASVDHRISQEHKPQERMALLQDKMVFALMRVMGWPARRICRLTIGEIATLLPRPKETSPVDFTTEPRDVASMCSHSWWFIESIRPKIPGVQATDRLVVSPTTGKPLGGNALWLRFHRAVTEAFLTAEIPDLVAFRRSVRSSGCSQM
jgi:hypothetical protein